MASKCSPNSPPNGECNGGEDEYALWTSITSPVNKAWLLDNVLENNVPDALRHSASWRAFHGKPIDGSSKWGEADYTGNCQAGDYDCDGWYDAHDNCPYVWNPDQADRDDDNAGDLCEACPWDPNNDEDKDGLCGELVRPEGVGPVRKIQHFDNCPKVANPDQKNCNAAIEEAERSRGANVSTLGDACDPVPCPSPEVSTQPINLTIPNRWLPSTSRGRAKLSAVTVKRLAPRKETTGQAFPIASEWTLARFCQATPGDPGECRRLENLNEDHRDFFLNAASELPDRARPWLRVSVGPNGNNPDQQWTWPYNDSTQWHNWSYVADYARWTSGGLIPLPAAGHPCYAQSDPAIGPGTCLGGTLWYSSRSLVGGTVDNGAGMHAPKISDGYVDVAPDMAYNFSYPGIPVEIVEFNLANIRKPPFPCPEWLFRPAPLAFEPWSESLLFVEDNGAARDISASMSVGLKSVLSGHLLSAPLSAPVGASLPHEPRSRRAVAGRSSASTSGYLEAPVWAGIQEHPNLPSQLDPRVQAVAVSADGTRVLDTVLLDYDQLVTASELGVVVSSPDEGGRPPSPRSDFRASLSLQLGGVFIVGGSTASGWSNEVHLYRFGIGWTSVKTSVSLGRVEAALYSAADGGLWVVDSPMGYGPTRVLFVNPWTGTTTVMTSISPTWTVPRNSLVLDHDGHVILVTATPPYSVTHYIPGSTVVRKLKVNGGALSVKWGLEEFPYSSDPLLLTEEGYGIISRDSSGTIDGITRWLDLQFAP